MRALLASSSFVAAVSVVIVACSDFDASDSGGPDAAAGDATTADDGATADAGTTSWCEGKQGLFCDDFETDRRNDTSAWSGNDVTAGATLEIVSAPRDGAPANKALRAALTSSGPLVSAALFKRLAGGKKSVTYSFDVQVKKLTATTAMLANVDISELIFTPSSKESWINVEHAADDTLDLRAWPKDGQPIPVVSAPGFQTNKWHRVRVNAYAVDVGNDKLSVSFDVMPTPLVVDGTFVVLDDRSIALGPRASTPAEVEILYDNFLLEAHE